MKLSEFDFDNRDFHPPPLLTNEGYQAILTALLTQMGGAVNISYQELENADKNHHLLIINWIPDQMRYVLEVKV